MRNMNTTLHTRTQHYTHEHNNTHTNTALHTRTQHLTHEPNTTHMNTIIHRLHKRINIHVTLALVRNVILQYNKYKTFYHNDNILNVYNATMI